MDYPVDDDTLISDQLPSVNTISPDLLEAEISKLKAEFDEVPEGFEEEEALINQLPDEVRARINELTWGLVDGEISESEYSDGIKDIPISESVIRATLRKGQIARDLRSIESQLLPIKLVEMKKDVEYWKLAINWNRVVNYFSNPDPEVKRSSSDLFSNFIEYDYGFLIKLSDLLAGGELKSYLEFSYYRKQFEEKQKEFIEKDLYRPVDSLTPDVNEADLFVTDEAKADLKLDLDAKIKTIEEFSSLKWLFRPSTSIGNTFGQRFLMEVSAILDTKKYPVQFPKRLLGMLGLKANSIFTDEIESEISEARLVESKSLEIDSLVNLIKIAGVEAKPGRILVITEDDIRKVLRNIPPAFLKKINVIKRVPKPRNDAIQSIDEDEGIKIGDVSGEFFPESDAKNNLTSGDINIYWPCDIRPDASEDEINNLKEEFSLTLYHEIGHRIHFELSEEEMTEWLKISSDGYNITEYVESSRDKNVNRGIREDFCETFMYFMKHSGIVHYRSPDRFTYFARLLAKYMPKVQATSFLKSLI